MGESLHPNSEAPCCYRILYWCANRALLYLVQRAQLVRTPVPALAKVYIQIPKRLVGIAGFEVESVLCTSFKVFGLSWLFHLRILHEKPELARELSPRETP